MVMVVSLFSGDGWPLSGWNVGAFGALGLGGLFHATLVNLITYGISRISAVLANNIFQLEAPLTMALAFLVFKEFPSLKELFGAALIFSGAYLMNRLENKS